MPGLMRGGWKRGSVSGPPSLQSECVDSAGPYGYRASLLLYPLAQLRLARNYVERYACIAGCKRPPAATH
jgi:hypothetical protein